MPRVYAHDGVIPVVDKTSFVHPTAVLIGDVIVGPGCYIGPNAVVRGDFGRITIGAGSNIQETCVLHSFPSCDTVVEAGGHIGHGAVLHGCHLHENVLVGMNAVVMDAAVIGENAIIGALAFVKANSTFEPASMIVGAPAKSVRHLSEQEIAWKREGTGVYQTLAATLLADGVTQTEALTEVAPNRPRVRAPCYDPLFATRLAVP